mmetsp:Transcript_7337/g.10247  ORF Transcript_7337/g.10247 Transcript_7337/m.10247 type:complete len:408 (+) Transcript_7337:1600-2823(+)
MMSPEIQTHCYSKRQKRTTKYIIVGVMEHSGSETKGHYTVFLKHGLNPHKSWFMCDDEKVSRSAPNLEANTSCTLLVYTRSRDMRKDDEEGDVEGAGAPTLMEITGCGPVEVYQSVRRENDSDDDKNNVSITYRQTSEDTNSNVCYRTSVRRGAIRAGKRMNVARSVAIEPSRIRMEGSEYIANFQGIEIKVSRDFFAHYGEDFLKDRRLEREGVVPPSGGCSGPGKHRIVAPSTELDSLVLSMGDGFRCVNNSTLNVLNALKLLHHDTAGWSRHEMKLFEDQQQWPSIKVMLNKVNSTKRRSFVACHLKNNEKLKVRMHDAFEHMLKLLHGDSWRGLVVRPCHSERDECRHTVGVVLGKGKGYMLPSDVGDGSDKAPPFTLDMWRQMHFSCEKPFKAVAELKLLHR